MQPNLLFGAIRIKFYEGPVPAEACIIDQKIDRRLFRGTPLDLSQLIRPR